MEKKAIKKPPMRWRRQPNETGLARVCQGPRGFELVENKQILAHVSYSGFADGWYFYAEVLDRNINSLAEGMPVWRDVEEAKAAAKEWVLAVKSS